ncbi:hypothetical protein CON70_01625 [Bacillus pseudomycoides]|nr:hypothetical protein CON70_01625 [Bacillus pseudomycoides]
MLGESIGPLNGHKEQGTSRKIVLLESPFITHLASLNSRVIQHSMKWFIGMLARSSNPPTIKAQTLTTDSAHTERMRETRVVYSGPSTLNFHLSNPWLGSRMPGELRGPLNGHKEQETSRKIVLLQSPFITHFASLDSRVIQHSMKWSIGMLARSSNPSTIRAQTLTTDSTHTERMRETRVVYSGPSTLNFHLSNPWLGSRMPGEPRGPLNGHKEQETSRKIVLLQSSFITHFASLNSRVTQHSMKWSIEMLVRSSNPPETGIQPLKTQQPGTQGEAINTNLLIAHTRYASREWELTKLQSELSQANIPNVDQPGTQREAINTNLLITHTRYASREWELTKLQSELSQANIPNVDQPGTQKEAINTNLFITHTRYASREWQLTKLQSVLFQADIPNINQTRRIANSFSNSSMAELINRKPAAYQRVFLRTALQDNKQFREDPSSFSKAPAMDLVKLNEESSPVQTQSSKNNKVETSSTSSAYSPGQSPVLDISRLTDQVYQAIERKIRIERERRGL